MKALLSILFTGIFLFFSCEENAINPERANVPNADFTQSQNEQYFNVNASPLEGNSVQNGFDEYGFNFQAHLFDGYLINTMIGDPAFKDAPHYRHEPYKGEGEVFWNNFIADYPYFANWMPPGLLDCRLIMRWNDALLPASGVYPETWNDTDAYIQFKYTMQNENENWKHIRKLVAIHTGDYLEGDRWYNQYGEEIGMKSYYWADRLIIVQVLNVGGNPYVPWAMPPDYTAPNGHGWGKYKNAR